MTFYPAGLTDKLEQEQGLGISQGLIAINRIVL